jgi:hypothetical protein
MPLVSVVRLFELVASLAHMLLVYAFLVPYAFGI